MICVIQAAKALADAETLMRTDPSACSPGSMTDVASDLATKLGDVRALIVQHEAIASIDYSFPRSGGRIFQSDTCHFETSCLYVKKTPSLYRTGIFQIWVNLVQPTNRS